MVWQLYCHIIAYCLGASTLGRRDKVPIQLPTWLGLGFVTVYTTGYCRLIVAGRGDSSIVITRHWGASTLLEEDKAKRSAKQSTACCRWTLWQHIRGCAIQSLMDAMVWQLHHHHHCILLGALTSLLGEERGSASPATNLVGTGLGDCVYLRVLPSNCFWPWWQLHHHCVSLRSINIAQGGYLPSNTQRSAAELCVRTLEDVPYISQRMWWYGSCIAIIIAYCCRASTLLKEGDTKGLSSTEQLDLVSSFCVL
jgi:hypothetical protein